MGSLDELSTEKYQQIEGNAAPLSEALTGGHRTPPDMPTADGTFQNGSDLSGPPDTTPAISAKPDGGVKVVIDDKIELICFGTVYRDRRAAFAHDAIDDTDPKVDLSAMIGGHAIQYRAALERETILLSGLLAAHQDALTERDKDEGTLGTVMGVVGNLLGAGGMSAKAEPADLNPYVAQLTSVAGAVDAEAITYDVTHQAGIDLHKVRASYCAYLDQQLDKQKKPKQESSLLSSIPLLKGVLPDEIANIFVMVEKMSSLAFDVYTNLILELTRTMMPLFDSSCRDITIDSIQNRRVPIFDVWLPPPPPGDDPSKHLIQAPKTPGKVGFDPLDNLVQGFVGKVQDVVGSVNDAADPVVDFLTRPGKASPGGPFLDHVFAQLADKTGYLQTAGGAPSIGDLAVKCVVNAFGFDPPAFVKSLITRVIAVHADFLRGVYGQLVSLDPTKPIVEEELVIAGRSHLVSQVIEALAHSLSFLDTIRGFHFGLQIFGPIDKELSGEALFQRAKELLDNELGPHLDPIIELLMRDFAKVLEGARLSAQGSMTMEVYLARLPTLYALLFRKTFFPVWDLLVHTVFKAVSDVLDPMTGKVAELANKAKGIVDTVRTGLLRAKNVAVTALTQGIQGGLGGTNLGAYRDAMKSVLGDPTAPPPVAPLQGFPFPDRKTHGSGTAVDDDTLKKVEPDDKWKDDAATSDAGTKRAAAA